MATPNQIKANQANAQKSTGPKTEEGKAASSKNRLSHGFTSSASVIPGEDPEEFKALLVDLAQEYNPETASEQILIEKMALNQWLTLRAFRLQNAAFMEQAVSGRDSLVPKDLGLLIRYQTTAERAFHQALTDLVKVQKERKKSEIGFVSKKAGDQSKSESKTVHITWIDADSRTETAPPAAPGTQSGPEIAPEAPAAAQTAA